MIHKQIEHIDPIDCCHIEPSSSLRLDKLNVNPIISVNCIHCTIKSNNNIIYRHTLQIPAHVYNKQFVLVVMLYGTFTHKT